MELHIHWRGWRLSDGIQWYQLNSFLHRTSDSELQHVQVLWHSQLQHDILCGPQWCPPKRQGRCPQHGCGLCHLLTIRICWLGDTRGALWSFQRWGIALSTQRKILFIWKPNISGVKVTVTSPECHDPYQITDGCSVSASSSLDDTTLPANVLANDDTYWAPAIRSDKYIKHYTNSKLDSNETFPII